MVFCFQPLMADTTGAFNTGFDTVSLHHHTTAHVVVGGPALSVRGSAVGQGAGSWEERSRGRL